CTSFTELPGGVFTDGCDDDTCAVEALQSVITTQLNAGTTYYIVMWEFGNAAPVAGFTNIQLQVSRFLPEANDTCAGAIPLSLNSRVDATTTSGSTPTATNDYNLSGSGCFAGIGQTASTADGIDVVYSFTAPTAGNYSFRVFNYTTAFSNLVLYVASTCPAATPGTPVTVATCLGASNRAPDSVAEEVMCLSLTLNQQVFVFVDEAAATVGSPYTIEVTRCTRETEPNDTPGTSNAIAFGIEGTIGTAAEIDFYSLGTPAAGSRVFALVDGAAANNGDFDLRVNTSTDTLEFDDLDTDFLFGGISPTVGGTPLTGAPTFLRVNESSFASVAAEPYRLYAVVQPPIGSATLEVEPNNTIGEASTSTNQYFSGSLAGPAPSTDIDIFSFSASTGDLVFISLDGDPLRNNTPLDARLALLNSLGAVLVEVDDSSQTSNTSSGVGSLVANNPFSPAEGLVYRVTQPGTYYARVVASSVNNVPSAAGDYLLSISRNGGPGPTAVKFSDEQLAGQVKATRYTDGVVLQWRTGMEVDNLGFNVYREEGGRRVRLNQQLLAGSALMVGPETELRSGRPYAWTDRSASSAGARYWIEDVDLNGTSTLHGPIAVEGSRVRKSTGASQQATQLSRLGSNSAQENITAAIEPRAELTADSGTDDRNLAGQPAVKLLVRQAGIYRVSQPELVAAGLDPKADPRRLQLYANGRELPILVTGDKDGRFDAADTLEFYGIGLDTPSTDARTYWLIAGSTPGKRVLQVTAAASVTGPGAFQQTVERKDRTIYFSSLRNGDKENFFGAVIAGTPVDHVLTLQHLASGATGLGEVNVVLQGVTNVSHRVRVEVNGASAGELSFDGQASGVTRFALPQAVFKQGPNVVRLTPLGGPSDVCLVDRIQITYWHALTADANSLRFTAAAKQAVTVDGFGSAQVRVFDVTDPNAIQEVLGTIGKGSSGFGVSFAVPGAGIRNLLAITSDQAKQAASITANRPSNWRQPSQAADLVIVTRREFASAVEPLRSLRQSQGLNTVVVDVEDLYDEFSYGNPSPQALKDFLFYATMNWRLAPQFVLLAGDSSYDPKNYLGLGGYDLVPTKLIDTRLMETACDGCLGDFDGDGLSEVSIGRLPVRNALEAASVVSKIVGYDESKPASGVLLVSDTNDGFDFGTMTSQLRASIPESVIVEEINRGQGEATTVKSSLLKALNGGPRIVNYAGHGSAEQWRGSFLTAADAGALTNKQSLSLFVSMTCLNGFFHDPSLDSLAEVLMKSRGGAVAVWASSGMTAPAEQAAMDQQIFKLMFDAGLFIKGKPQTIGEATNRAKAAVSDADVRRTWILFGDPSTRLR
ncbi:MAG TPA: C25 family cysteine peptidase, partial [Blastocatellia bacterium]|nr:C25 family cysteine peptidase [Blastocatellia bacterium]